MPIEMLRAGDARFGALACVHPITGHVRDYRSLARVLSWPGPIVGVSAPPHDGDDAAYELSRLAARYREELSAWPSPLHLVGWALGGVIAAELACVVGPAGVGFLGLIDSRAPVPEMRTRPTHRDALARSFVAQRAMMRDRPPPTIASTEASELLATLRASDLADDLGNEAELEAQLAISFALTRAFYRHEQRALAGTVYLFESDSAHPAHPKPPSLGWENHAERLEKRVVPGTHFTVLRDPVEPLARSIEACLPSNSSERPT
jgi:thioesterase domain-containing protein